MSKKYLETIKAVDGELFHLEFHQLRLEKALHNSAVYSLKELLHPPKKGIYRCRIVYDAQSIEIAYIKYIKRRVHTLRLVYTNVLEYVHKYENREELDRLFSQKESCDDVLIVQNGFVCDTSIANIALFNGDVWHTPSKPLLEGTTRARLLKSGSIISKNITPKELKNYSKIALMNAMIDFDIIAVENIEDIIC